MSAQAQAKAEESPRPVCVFIFWEHSNIFIEACNIAEETEMVELGEDVGKRLRIDFRHMLTIAHENRPVARAVAAGSVPPEMKAVWQQLEREGVSTEICDRSVMGGREREVPDLHLQKEMLRDGVRGGPLLGQ